MSKSNSSRTESGTMPEHHLQDIIKNAPIGVFTSTPEGRYTSANPALARMFGYESPEALIASITDIATQVYADPADREAFMRLMAEHGEAVDYECRFKRKDGTEFWVSRNVREIRDEDGRVVAYQGFSTDITERKQAEEAWRGSEERYRNVAEANAGMVWDLDANLTVTHVSGRVYEILGYEPEAIIGRNPLFPVDPEDRERISAVMARMLRQQEPVKDIEYWCRHSDGGRVRILTNGVPFFAKDGGLLGFRGTHIDMTETYWARRCRKITLQLHKMINESDNAISAVLCEACSEVTDSTMAFFGMLEPDESAMIAHVWSPAAMAECRIADKPLRFPIETAGLWAEPIRRKQPVILNDYPNAPEKGGLPEGHVPITRYLGVPILHGDKVVAVVGAANRAPGYEERHIDRLRMITSTMADILLLRRNEEALRDQSQLLHNIIDTAADLLSVTDLEGNFKFVGPSHGILGYDPDSLVGRNVMEFVHPDDYPETATAFADFLANREDGRKVEYRYRRADGDYFWFETIGKFIRDDAGNPKEILFSTRNVTARKQAEGQLKRIEWMLSRKPVSDIEARTEAHDQGYSDLTELNRNGIILKSIGHELLKSFSNDYLELLETSSAIYEENGDYAFGIFTSGWCRMMDRASRNLCDTPDNAEALNSGRWLCHESCWTDCSKQAIAKRTPVDIECHGGLRIYAIPIFAGENVVGAINFGYGDPPTDEEQLRKLAETYHLDYEDLVREADAYDSRPPFIIEVAKKRLHSTARIIGSMIETKQTEEALRKSEETLRTTLHSIGDAVISTDMDGLIAAMNPVAESLTGWSEEEATGQALETVFRIINEQTRRPVESPVANVLRSDHIVGLANHTLLIAKDGREIPIADSGAPIRNDAGGITGVVLVFRDQTEERAAREALEASEATIRNKLKAITEPGGDIGTLSLGDIIDSEELQNMIEDLFKISKVGGAILDISGKVLVSVKMEDICGKFHRVHPETAKNCLESDLALANGVPAGTFKAYRCKNNMWDMVSPIIIGGKHLGNIYIGQFFYDDERVDYESFRKQARRYGFDETEYLAALDRVPRLKRETVESAMTFYAKLAGMISSLSYSKIKLSRDIVRRKRAEEALRESETRFQKMLGVVPDMISIQNPEMDILYSNWQGLAAVPDNRRILHTKCHKTYRNFDNICPDCLATSVLENRTPVHEETRLPDGKWYDIRVIPILDKDNNVEMFMEWVRDITESKQAEEALRESEEKHRRLFETMAQGVVYHAADGTIISANPAAERILGLSFDQMQDRLSMDPRWGIVNEDGTEVPVMDYPYMIPLRTGETFGPAIRGVSHPDKNAHVWLSITAIPLFQPGETKPFQVYTTFEDITERKQAEKDLIESEARFKALHNASFGGIAIHDQGVILECNQGLTEITGFGYDELIGMDGLLLIAEKFREAVMNNIRSGYEKPYEVFGVRKDGEEYPLRLEARNIPYKGKRVRVVEFRDITDLKRAEEEREKLQGQLTQAQKMESVGRLAGGVAHDFNNMLGVILGHAEMVMDQVDPSQPLFTDLEEIRKAAERSAILTRQLLTFARKQTIAPKVIDLNETVEGMLKMLRRLIGEDIDCPGGPAKTFGRSRWILPRSTRSWPIYASTPGTPSPTWAKSPSRRARPRLTRPIAPIMPDLSRASLSCWRSATTAAAWTRRPSAICSSRFSPPRMWARAPAWGWPRFTARSSRTKALSTCTVSRARGRPSGSICRRTRPGRGFGLIRQRQNRRRAEARPSCWWRTSRPICTWSR